ncbi:hypothetical protein BREVUG8_110189 [Brevundimonas sp. G8]|nr:hypothetical protein BREVUG8_110189 [Brevundimonas sp. G8]
MPGAWASPAALAGSEGGSIKGKQVKTVSYRKLCVPKMARQLLLTYRAKSSPRQNAVGNH